MSGTGGGFSDIVTILKNLNQNISVLNSNLTKIASVIPGIANVSDVQIQSFLGTTNSSGQFSVTFPVVFSAAPTVVTSNGDSASGEGETVTPLKSSITTTGFTAQWATAVGTPTASGQVRRVNYVAAA
jgi:hypothetical protein